MYYFSKIILFFLQIKTSYSLCFLFLNKYIHMNFEKKIFKQYVKYNYKNFHYNEAINSYNRNVWLCYINKRR